MDDTDGATQTVETLRGFEIVLHEVGRTGGRLLLGVFVVPLAGDHKLFVTDMVGRVILEVDELATDGGADDLTGAGLHQLLGCGELVLVELCRRVVDLLVCRCIGVVAQHRKQTHLRGIGDGRVGHDGEVMECVAGRAAGQLGHLHHQHAGDGVRMLLQMVVDRQSELTGDQIVVVRGHENDRTSLLGSVTKQ